MANITLTDRISVRVTAKNDTEASTQKKRDGGNVASALGGTGLTDAEKEEIGNSLGETVTGEDGKVYAKSEKIAGALKNLKTNGKLSEPEEVHEGIEDHNGNIVNIPEGTIVRKGPAVLKKDQKLSANDDYYGQHDEYTLPDNVYYVAYKINNSVFYDAFSKESFTVSGKHWSDSSANSPSIYEKAATAKSVTITTKNGNRTYSFFVANNLGGATAPDTENPVSVWVTPSGDNPAVTSITYSQFAAYLFGPSHISGGAPLDPTGKTDDQIKKDIEDAATANNAIMHFGSNPTDTYVAVTDANGNPLYFLGT